MEAADASSSGDRPRTLLKLPAGYHFAPTEEELIVHYLRRKIDGFPLLLPIFNDFNVVSMRPAQITDKFKDCGEDRWYFFTKRHRKYSKGNRPNRTTPGNGFWKATGPQRMIYSGKKEERRLVGRVRTLVFYQGPDKEKALPKKVLSSEDKTSWTMYEYENLTSEEEAADQSVDKLDEWVLCTIQKQKKKEEGEEKKEEGSENEVKETKEKEKIKEGGGARDKKGEGKIKKKRKVKREKMEAENGTDEDPFQVLDLMKRSKVPMLLPAHLETFAPEEGYATGMMFANSCPRKSSSPVPTVQQQNESPRSETMSPPCIIDNDYYDPNMAQTPCLHELQMTSTAAGGNYNIGSDGMSWHQHHGSQIPRACLHGFSPSIVATPLPQEAPNMEMEYQTSSSFPGYNNSIIDPSMATYHPATSCYPYLPSALAQNAVSRYCYATGDLASIFGNSSTGFNFADSLQYQGGLSLRGPAAPVAWQGQVR